MKSISSRQVMYARSTTRCYTPAPMKRALLLAAAILLVRPLTAQETHAAYERGGKPGAGQALLAQFAGDWTMVKTFFPAKGEPVVTRGTCHQAMIADGRFLQSDFVFFDKNGKK